MIGRPSGEPGRSPAQLTYVLESLAAITPFALGTLEDLLAQESPRLPWGATLVVVTGTLTPEMVATLRRLRQVGRVVWDPHMLVLTSARRLRGMGTLAFFRHHATNYVRMYATGQSSDNFEPYR